MSDIEVLKRIRKIAVALSLVFIANSQLAISEDINNLGGISIGYDDANYSDYLISVINELPENLLLYLNNRKSNFYFLGGENRADELYKKIYVSDKSNNSIIGFCDWENKIVFVEASMHNGYRYTSRNNSYTEEEFNKLVIKNILLHEIGHLLDYFSKYTYSQSSSFSKIYKAEKEKFKETRTFKVDGMCVEANISDLFEYFASAFACYINYPEDLSSFCPLTYDYVDSLVNEISFNKDGTFYFKQKECV